MKNGGKRPGAGGIELNGWSKKFADYFTPEEVWEFVADIKERAKKDPRIAIWVGEHIFGKAVQPIEGTGENGEIILKMITYGNNSSAQVPAKTVSIKSA